MLKKLIFFIVFVILISVSLNGSQNAKILEKIAKVGFFGSLITASLSIVPLIITYRKIAKFEKKNRPQGAGIFIIIPFWTVTVPLLLLSGLSLSIAAGAKLGALGVKRNVFTQTQYGLGLAALISILYFYYLNKQKKLSHREQN